MAKRRKKSSSKGCPEPLNTMIDLAGAAAMGAFAKHKIKRDYAKGQGKESIEAAMMVYGMGAFRRGSAGLMSLGGLYGVNSAIKDIERSEQARRLRTPVYDDGIDLSFYKTNDNRYAWRLNCEDGSDFGVYPENYETRDEYNEALREAKEDYGETEDAGDYEQPDMVKLDTEDAASELATEVYFCRVSLLSNGKTEYFRTIDQTIKRGDIVTVPDGDSTTTGVVVSIEHFSPGAYPQPLGETAEIIGRVSEQ